MRYELYYWPGIQGRGGGVPARLGRRRRGLPGSRAATARDDGDVAFYGKSVGQAAALRAAVFESRQAGRRPRPRTFYSSSVRASGSRRNQDAGRLWAHQLQLTIADWVGEVHDSHHPIAGSLYYEDQKREAKRRASNFTAERLPKFLHYFEQVLARRIGGRALVGQRGFLRRSVALPDDRRVALRLSAHDDQAGNIGNTGA